MFKSLVENHWFWKKIIIENRLLNSTIDNVNRKILYSESIFYILLFVKLTFMMFGFNDYLNSEIIDPLWSVFWVQYFPNFPWIASFIIICFSVNTLIIFFGSTRILKITLFVTCFICKLPQKPNCLKV